MSWRIVKIEQRAKLDFSMNMMVVRGLETTRIHLSEISVLLIENTSVSLTAALMVELVKRKIKVIFCDEEHNPSFETTPYYGSHDTSLRLKQQIAWDEGQKGLIWTEIVGSKIQKQKELLEHFSLEQSHILEVYEKEVEFRDSTNREAHAAKVYFNALFGLDFARSKPCVTNAALNYGYSMLLSGFNREIVSSGYVTQLGLFHDNRFNTYNLACDFMESFRPLVDYIVKTENFQVFEREEKNKMINVLNMEVMMDGKRHYVNNAIGRYSKSIFDSLEEKDLSLMKCYAYEF
ncbi:MAG: type II CRISPR-associated endonuclease Cas1 [Eubacteriales bacterium]